MPADSPGFPSSHEHLALAGMTGTGKTWGALDMLSYRDLTDMAWIIVDHKRDSSLKRVPAEKLSVAPSFLPRRGLHIIRPRFSHAGDAADLEDTFNRVFKHGRIGIYIDEGHLLGMSDALRKILVAGRDKQVPVMWISQKANWIDTFIWAQSTFYRVFRLQTAKDIKAVQDNWPVRFQQPARFHSWYYDGNQGGAVYYLAPADALKKSIERIDSQLAHTYTMI